VRRIFLAILLATVVLFTAGAGYAQAVQDGVPADHDPYLARYVLRDAAGHPMANAALRVEVIPDGFARAQWGARSWPLAGAGVTDNSGHPLVHLQAPSAPPLRSADGVVNYEIYAVSAIGAEVPMQVFTRYYGSDHARQQEFATLAATQPHTVTLSSSQMQVYQQTPQARLTGTAAHAMPLFCADYWYPLSYTDAWTIVGEFHTAPWAVTGTHFGYGTTADSNIEVADQASNGNVSDMGTINISNSQGSRYTWNENGVWFGYQIDGLFHYEHDGLYNCYGIFVGVYQDMADYWDGGLHQGTYEGNHDNTPTNYTIKVAAGNAFSRTTGTAFTYSGAVTVFTVSLHAQSGYTTSVDMNWQAGSSDGYLYGYGAFPDQASLIFVATYYPLGNHNCS
jgi:hypothetical protein